MLNNLRFISIKAEPKLIEKASIWFSSKWGVPSEAYFECMKNYVNNETKLGWYLCLDNDKIIGGLGVIENDFHERKDLTPNICAVYVEEEYRNQGIAGRLLNLAVDDLKMNGISPVYLITDHVGFYERYGFTFLAMTKCDNGDISRIYIHK